MPIDRVDRIRIVAGSCAGHSVGIDGTLRDHDAIAEATVEMLGGAVSDCYRLAKWIGGQTVPDIHMLVSDIVDVASLAALRAALRSQRRRKAPPPDRAPTPTEARISRAAVGARLMVALAAGYDPPSVGYVAPGRRAITVGADWLAYLASIGLDIAVRRDRIYMSCRCDEPSMSTIMASVRHRGLLKSFVAAMADAMTDRHGWSVASAISQDADGVDVVADPCGAPRVVPHGCGPDDIWPHPFYARDHIVHGGRQWTHVAVGDVICTLLDTDASDTSGYRDIGVKLGTVRMTGVSIGPCAKIASGSPDNYRTLEVPVDGAATVRLADGRTAPIGPGYWLVQVPHQRGTWIR